MKALELIGLVKSTLREDALSTMPILDKVFKIKTGEVIKVVKQDDAYITYVVKSGEDFGTDEIQVSLNDFEGLLPTEYAVESLEDSDIDALAGEWEDFWGAAKKMVPNIKGTSAALAALNAARQSIEKFFDVAGQSVATEALSVSDAKIQAQQLVQYLLKFNDPDKQAEAGAKWFDSKDFAPADKALIFKEYDKLTTGKKLVDSSEIEDFGEANESAKVIDFKILNLGVVSETPQGIDQEGFANIIVASGTSARDAGEEAIDVLSGEDVEVTSELESAVGELSIEDDAKDGGFHYVALLFNKEVSEAKILASSGDKSKFANLKKQIDDLEKQKIEIRGQLAALVGKDEPAKSDALRDKRTAILNKITKLEDEKRKMMNQFRGLRGK